MRSPQHWGCVVHDRFNQSEFIFNIHTREHRVVSARDSFSVDRACATIDSLQETEMISSPLESFLTCWKQTCVINSQSSLQTRLQSWSQIEAFLFLTIYNLRISVMMVNIKYRNIEV